MENQEFIRPYPFVINIENKTNKIIENVPIFFSASVLGKKFNSDNNLEENGLIISSTEKVSYKQILDFIVENPINVKVTSIESDLEENIKNSFKYNYKGANGHFFGNHLIMLSDNDYSINSQLKTNYRIDCFTSLILTQIQPNSKIQLKFFSPKQEEGRQFFDVFEVQQYLDILIKRDKRESLKILDVLNEEIIRQRQAFLNGLPLFEDLEVRLKRQENLNWFCSGMGASYQIVNRLISNGGVFYKDDFLI
jgi:hypothetical protein